MSRSSGRDAGRGAAVAEAVTAAGGHAVFVPADLDGTLRPDAIAAAALYLASDETTGVHGTSLDVDGGRGSVAVFAV